MTIWIPIGIALVAGLLLGGGLVGLTLELRRGRREVVRSRLTAEDLERATRRLRGYTP